MRYLIYTFTAAFGLFVSVLSLLTVTIMAACYVLDKPLAFVLTLSAYIAIFGAGMLGNYFRYMRYRETAMRTVRYNHKTHKMEEIIL